MKLLSYLFTIIYFFSLLFCLYGNGDHLPPNWSRHNHQGREYYYNSVTGVSQWEKPLLPPSQQPLTSGPNTPPAAISTSNAIRPSSLHRLRRKHHYIDTAGSSTAGKLKSKTSPQSSDNETHVSTPTTVQEKDVVDPSPSHSTGEGYGEAANERRDLHPNSGDSLEDKTAVSTSADQVHITSSPPTTTTTPTPLTDEEEQEDKNSPQMTFETQSYAQHTGEIISKNENVEKEDEEEEGLEITENDFTVEDLHLHADPIEVSLPDDDKHEEENKEDAEGSVDDDYEGDDDDEGWEYQSEAARDDVSSANITKALHDRIHDLERKLVHSLEENRLLESSLTNAQEGLNSYQSIVDNLRFNSTRYTKALRLLKTKFDQQKEELLKTQRNLAKSLAERQALKIQSEVVASELKKQLAASLEVAASQPIANSDPILTNQLSSENIEEEEEEEADGGDSEEESSEVPTEDGEEEVLKEEDQEQEQEESEQPAQSPKLSIFANFWKRKHSQSTRSIPIAKKATEVSVDRRASPLLIQQMEENMTALSIAMESREETIRELLVQVNESYQISREMREEKEELAGKVNLLEARLHQLLEKAKQLSEEKEKERSSREDLELDLEQAKALHSDMVKAYQSHLVQVEKQKRIHLTWINILLQLIYGLDLDRNNLGSEVAALYHLINEMADTQYHLEGQLKNATTQLMQHLRIQAISKVEAVTSVPKRRCCLFSFLKWW
eukprot:gene3026-3298_t